MTETTIQKEDSKENYSKAMSINVQFPVQGQKLPADHGYLLYAAISQLKPELHETGWLGIEMISGIPFGKGLIALPTRNAKLHLRIPADKFGEVLSLAGKRLDIEEHTIRLGIPMAQPLLPATSLYARIVIIRGFMEIPEFLEAAKRQLEELNIKATLEMPKEGQSRLRRILTIKDKKIVGFSVVAHGLNEEDSIKLQAHGIGGRRAMGCGIFNPIRKPFEFEAENNE